MLPISFEQLFSCDHCNRFDFRDVTSEEAIENINNFRIKVLELEANDLNNIALKGTESGQFL